MPRTGVLCRVAQLGGVCTRGRAPWLVPRVSPGINYTGLHLLHKRCPLIQFPEEAGCFLGHGLLSTGRRVPLSFGSVDWSVPLFFHFLKNAEVFSGELRGLGGGGQREGMGDICDSVNNKKGKNWDFPNVGQREATPRKGGFCLAEGGVFQQPWPLPPLPPLFLESPASAVSLAQRRPFAEHLSRLSPHSS